MEVIAMKCYIIRSIKLKILLVKVLGLIGVHQGLYIHYCL